MHHRQVWHGRALELKEAAARKAFEDVKRLRDLAKAEITKIHQLHARSQVTTLLLVLCASKHLVFLLSVLFHLL